MESRRRGSPEINTRISNVLFPPASDLPFRVEREVEIRHRFHSDKYAVTKDAAEAHEKCRETG